MRTNSSLNFGRNRDGVTVIETLFAMGIALMGLAGIASLLLLAGRQASDSNRLSEAQSFAHDWYSEFTGRGLNNTNRWAWCNDTPSTPVLVGFNKLLATSFPSKGSTAVFLRELGRESVCLDPKFFSSREIGNLPDDSGWYRPSVFPYYADRYNPTMDPAYTAGTSTHFWGDQPRMLRITTANVTSTGITATSANAVNRMFASEDDLSLFADDTDHSLPPVRLGSSRYVADSTYSWMATISPTEPSVPTTATTDLYTLSLVVIKNRDLVFILPAARGTGVAPLPSENPQGERNVWVIPQSGNFAGGSGGRVRIVGSEGIDSQIQVGDWIMLSKYYNIGFVSPSFFRPNSVFRWYRVVAVDSEEIVSDLGSVGVPDPYGRTLPAGQNVWFKDVVLDGPDWSFSPSVTVDTGSGLVTHPTPTTGTMVKGVVGVFERVVNVSTSTIP